jgi:uncharacterized membrane protein YvlD (DUF360 family)
MHFLKALTYNFFAIFFANYLLPGIELNATQKLPLIGHEIFFALGLALLNALIHPVFHTLLKAASVIRVILATFAINCIVYAGAKIFPLGIHIDHINSYFLICAVVSALSLLIGFIIEPKPPKKLADDPFHDESPSSDEDAPGS